MWSENNQSIGIPRLGPGIFLLEGMGRNSN
jgi:hypothetical protein